MNTENICVEGFGVKSGKQSCYKCNKHLVIDIKEGSYSICYIYTVLKCSKNIILR